jgi:hypothetical protein
MHPSSHSLKNTNFITNVYLDRFKPTIPKRTYRGNNFIPNYYKQSENNSKKIQSLNKTFEKIVSNAENKFKNANMRQKLNNEMSQIENNEIKRKAKRTQKQINIEMRQEKEERNQIERETKEKNEERNQYANYPTMTNFGKSQGKLPRSENILKYILKNPNDKVTKDIRRRYGNKYDQKGILAFPYGIGHNEPNAKARYEYNQISKNLNLSKKRRKRVML